MRGRRAERGARHGILIGLLSGRRWARGLWRPTAAPSCPKDAVTMCLPFGLIAALFTSSLHDLERLPIRLAGFGLPQPRRSFSREAVTIAPAVGLSAALNT